MGPKPMTPSEAIERVLKEAVPTADDNTVGHQMEYLRAHFREDHYVLEGPGYLEPPMFLDAFYGMGPELVPKIEAVLATLYRGNLLSLLTRVGTAIASLSSRKVHGDELWLNRKRSYPIGSEFLGLKVRYHDYDHEFVIAPTFGAMVTLREDDHG